MKALAGAIRNERGVALPLAVLVLLSLGALLLAFLSMGQVEPQVSRNLSELTRARYLADAGIEWAFDRLILAPPTGPTSWNVLLAGTPVVQGKPELGVWMAQQSTLPAPLNDPAVFGSYSVQIRNDIQPGDPALTGQPATDPSGLATQDQNGTLILTASGTFNGVTRTVQVVLRRVALPPFPGAFNTPGAQADIWFQNDKHDIDGKDYEWDQAANAYKLKNDQSKKKYGIATQTGYQQNIGNGSTTTYEERAEYKLNNNTPNKNYVHGKDQTNPTGPPTTGLNTVAGVDANTPEGLGPAKLQNFLTQLAQFSATTIYQSTQACATPSGNRLVGIRMIGNSQDPSKPTIQNNCGLNEQVDLGSREKPRLVYFRGDPDPQSLFIGVGTEGERIRGAGILIVEDGDFKIRNQFDWDGIIIATGKNVSVSFDGSEATIYGATVANETEACESGCPQDPKNNGVFWEGWFAGNKTTTLRFSQQTIDMVQRALLSKMSTWREL